MISPRTGTRPNARTRRRRRIHFGVGLQRKAEIDAGALLEVLEADARIRHHAAHVDFWGFSCRARRRCR
jgi:hypothetical protein